MGESSTDDRETVTANQTSAKAVRLSCCGQTSEWSTALGGVEAPTGSPGDRQPEEVLASHRLGDSALYAVGLFDKGITVLSQQHRALNLAWALVEGGVVRCQREADAETDASAYSRKRVAIIGAGFSGLTLAAGLLAKRANIDIALFERRDTLLPLQNGSDTRWLHPHIYDWPRSDSYASAAMLPLLNWTAGRASDVAVQVLTEWRLLLEKTGVRPTSEDTAGGPRLDLFCNARHLQIGRGRQGRLSVEWVAEARRIIDGTLEGKAENATRGASGQFDLVLLTIGFGLETGKQLSYWRNDFIAQPSLTERRQTYVISGQGDGAMIDLLRATITQFRQDRILFEVFDGQTALSQALRELKRKIDTDRGIDAYARMVQIFEEHGKFAEDRLRQRLRRDTTVVLRLKVRTISELFGEERSRISFQNKVLVYLLYRCGGFTPSSDEDDPICMAYGIESEQVVRRHGTNKSEQLRGVLSDQIQQIVEPYFESPKVASEKCQDDDPLWPGGYFGFPGTTESAKDLPDRLKGAWRREYLPSTTRLVAASFCAAVAGALAPSHDPEKRLRVTLHRVLRFGRDERLQQCCAYSGLNVEIDPSNAGRTFGISDGTIGLCVSTRSVLRTKSSPEAQTLDRAMNTLHLNRSSREMSKSVRSICAVPFLEQEDAYYGTSPVSMVLYADSEVPGFFSNPALMEMLSRMCRMFLSTCRELELEKPDRIVNVQGAEVRREVTKAREFETMDHDTTSALEVVSCFPLPKTNGPFQLNFDYSDFRVVAV